MNVMVYIDGFNFYYGVYVKNPALKSLKWIDYVKLSEQLLPKYKILKVKLFTAKVDSLGDPNRPVRQATLWRALKQVHGSRIEIIEGSFRTDPKRVPIARYPNDNPGNIAIEQKIWVMRTEEKGSDVNLAAHLVHDACRNSYDAAMILSNDSDLTEALRIVMQELKKQVILVNPYSIKKGKTVMALHKLAPNIKTLRKGILQSSQLPDPIPGTSIHKPSEWI